jgi:hypothetical protein
VIGLGIQGIAGPTGPQGVQGVQGLQGVTGWTGPPVTITNGAANRVLISTSSSAIAAQANLLFDGTTLDVLGQERSRRVVSYWSTTTGTLELGSVTGNANYNYITNPGFNTLILLSPGAACTGAYSVIKNGTSNTLSIGMNYVNGGTGPAPLVLAPSAMTQLIWDGSGSYLQF